LGLAAAFLLVAACATYDEPSEQSGNVVEHATESCTATLQILQKDAYRETAGRSVALWPPHTTTQLTVECDGANQEPVVVGEFVMANHGTEPGAIDVNGEVILVEVRADTISGERSELLQLGETFAACDCEGDSQFLSMDSLDDERVQELIGSLTAYLETSLSCPAGVDALIGAIQEHRMADALEILPTCSWADGSDLSTGLDKAVEEALLQSDEALQDYHLCNNDATLQVQLFEAFAQTGAVGSCDSTSALCHGPKWFYDPASE